jgi:hypothetical protein
LAQAHFRAGHDREAAKYADAAVDLGFAEDNYPLPSVREGLARHAGRYAEAAEIAIMGRDVRDPDQARVVEVIRSVYAALANPSRRNAALAARARLYPQSGTRATPGRLDLNLCLQSGSYYALMANDVAYGLLNQCLDAKVPGEIPQKTINNNIAAWSSPELVAFRQDPRFQAFATRIGLMDYWQHYGPPDGCDLKNGKLTCH